MFHELAQEITPAHLEAIRIATFIKQREAQEAEAATRRRLACAALIIACFILLLVWLLHEAKKQREETAQIAATTAVPPTRPPYNPALHGGIEAYNAGYGHLPPPPPKNCNDSLTVGLDRSAPVSNATARASAADEQRDSDARERKRRGW
jgi:hypothetical protein